MKAVCFDLGNTLFSSGLPLNWQGFYEEALKNVLRNIGLEFDPVKISLGEKILLKYNTRYNPREYEISSDIIFSELLRAWGTEDLTMLKTAKDTFFSYFHNYMEPYPETLNVLKTIRNNKLKTGILTDPAYGAEKEYLLSSSGVIIEFIDCFLSSTDTGFRKPNTRGYELLAEILQVDAADCLFVGDEQKDITGANNAGMVSVLIDRNNQKPDFGQKCTIRSLMEISALI